MHAVVVTGAVLDTEGPLVGSAVLAHGQLHLLGVHAH